MKIVFFGTPELSVGVLQALHKKFREKDKSPIVAVVTQPPKPVGRKKILTYSAVDKWGHKKNIPVYYNADRLISDKVKSDLGVLVSYGNILSKKVINHFPLGIINIHFSLLPKYRGASPVHSAIANGDKRTGITIMKLVEKLDAGAIVSQLKEDISEDDTTQILTKRLYEKSIDLLLETIPPYSKGKIKLKKQDENLVSYSKVLTKKNGFVELKNINSQKVERLIRAYHPWPGVWTRLKNGKRLKLLPNNKVQLEGKNPVSWEQFERAYGEVASFALD